MSAIKHDWYQTSSAVVVNILVKNCQSETTIIDITEQNVSMTPHNQPSYIKQK